MSLGLSFCCFDFSGCGNSEGERISFGANEKYDVRCVTDKLVESFGIRKVILWGRSMGAACAVKYVELVEKSRRLEERSQVMAIILDSCFASFSRLAV